MFFNRKKLNNILGIILIISFFFCWGLSNYKMVLPEQGVNLDIKEGDSVNTIASKLSQAGIIKFPEIFKLWLAWHGRLRDLKAGNYEFQGSVSISNVASKIANGQTNPAFKVTIPEGFNLFDVKTLLLNKKLISHEDKFDLSLLNSDEKAVYPFLTNWGTENPEGLLYPDTYFLSSHMTNKEILVTMLDNFNKKAYQPLQKNLETSQSSFKNNMILASLLEKEVVSYQDRRLVAGILEKRIVLGMPLQVDATICYIKESNGADNCNLTSSDFQSHSLYNTYKYSGLPPTPICNPSLEAIKAALTPQKSNYLYYLSSQKDSRTIFAKTYEEHLLNKAKYIK